MPVTTAGRTWSVEEINASLDLMALLPDLPGLMKKNHGLSKAVASRYGASRVECGPAAESYAVHLKPANGGAGKPVGLFVHGGYWSLSSAEDFLFVCAPFLERGMECLSINYPLCPAASFAQVVDATAGSIARLVERFAGRDIWIVGHSAGAHLAMMACTMLAAARHPDLANVKKAVLVGGLYDLEPVSRSLLQPTLRLTEDDIVRFSPVKLPVANGIAYRIIYGGDESPIFPAQSASLHQHLSRGADSALFGIDGRNHFDVLFSLTDLDAGASRKIWD